MLDFMFKLYYSFFVGKGRRGADAAIVLIAPLLALNVHMLLIYVLSFFVKIRDLSVITILLILAALVIYNFYYLNSRYAANGRYEKIIIENRSVYALGAIMHFLFSCITFPIFSYLIYENII